MSAKRKAEEGAQAPKRPQSGYGQFFAEKRAEISSTLLKEGVVPAKIMTASAKRAGELWKALGAAKQQPYNEKSEKLTLAYKEELDAFKTANPDFKKIKKGKKGDKPPSRPPGAYAMWMGDNRAMLTEKIMKDHGVEKSKAFFMMYKEARPVYDALSAAEKEKCEQKAEEAKVKFQVENKEWKENRKDDAKGNKADEPKRPLGAYAQWVADNRPMLTEKVMKAHNVDKSKAFLMLYKEGRVVYDALPAAERKECEEKAEAAKVKFQEACKEWKAKSKDDGEKDEDDEDVEESDHDEEEGKAKDQTTKRQMVKAKAAEKPQTTPPSKQQLKPSDASASKKQKVGGSKEIQIDEKLVKEAEGLKLLAQLKNLAARPDIAASGKSHGDMLNALKTSEGLVNKAKAVLLGA